MSENKACVKADKEEGRVKTCIWAEDADGNWHTGCQEIHVFISGTPQENGYVYCPYCGCGVQI